MNRKFILFFLLLTLLGLLASCQREVLPEPAAAQSEEKNQGTEPEAEGDEAGNEVPFNPDIYREPAEADRPNPDHPDGLVYPPEVLEEPDESGEKESIVLGFPEEEEGPEQAAACGTKIAFGLSGTSVHPSFQLGDKVVIVGRGTGAATGTFTATELLSGGRAVFTGSKPAGTRFDIVVVGKNSFANLRAMQNYDFSEQTQTGNNTLSHLQGIIWMYNVTDYREVTFSSAWASSHSGSFHVNPLVHFRIKIPSGSGTPLKIGLISVGTGEASPGKLLSHTYGGTKVNSIWLTLNSVSPVSDVFDAYLMLPEALAAGNYAVSLQMNNGYYYVKTFTASRAIAEGKVSKIQLNLNSGTTRYTTNADLGSVISINSSSSGTDAGWYSLQVLAHPNLMTIACPANALYDELYEVRCIADRGWWFGRMEFKMTGFDVSAPLDIAMDVNPSAPLIGGTWTLTESAPSEEDLYGDGQRAFSDALRIDRFYEHTGLHSSQFDNWTSDTNWMAWYEFTGSNGANIFGNLNRIFYTAQNPNQLTKYYTYATGSYYSAKSKGVIQFRMRRFSNYMVWDQYAVGFKLMGPGHNGEVGWHCLGLLPQGGKSASGIREVKPLKLGKCPSYVDYEYPNP